MMNFVRILCGSTPGQIQYGGFKRALAKKSGDMIRDRVHILYLLFLWSKNMADVEKKIEYLFYKGYTYEEVVGLLSVDYGPWLVFIVFSWIMKTRTSTSPYQEIKGSRHGGLF